MLHTETVEAGTLDLIKRLMSDVELSDFFMVGGTALSLFTWVIAFLSTLIFLQKRILMLVF